MKTIQAKFKRVKKIILTYGLIAGLMAIAMLLYSTIQCYTRPDSRDSIILNYGMLFLAFSMVSIGIKNYRDKYQNGKITFKKAFKIGFYITLLSSSMYVAVWLVEYYIFMPDFMEIYAAKVLSQLKSSGATASEIAARAEAISINNEMYKKPAFVVLFTYIKVFPLGCIISAISALVLRKKIRINKVLFAID
ncbi:DUF4199 domain-containing protein [Pedobacter metabolipauper]|uniref:Uncharacterized protein DUF4199 n=1 Tax=Pedobacter metabolipauper TaxID=425513 RepID=A0A4R6T308_9SPHI|nr:DUF4199 domain-containing protein [Pedobacter metabolipauper]TDQ11920.1 uncharacterized protein DUF4199 [Pedobacter metabolipauper]